MDAVVAVHHFLTAINILNLYRCRYRFGSNGFYEGGNKNRVAGKGLDDFQLFLTRLGPLRMIYVCVYIYICVCSVTLLRDSFEEGVMEGTIFERRREI